MTNALKRQEALTYRFNNVTNKQFIVKFVLNTWIKI